jgi:hypothetical protein
MIHFHKWKYKTLNANENKPRWRYSYVYRQCSCGKKQLFLGCTFFGFRIFKNISKVFNKISETEKTIIKNLLNKNELL